jgi:Lrp/AsnC family transcriptional regulator, regulator for asnA, asnC and gidA
MGLKTEDEKKLVMDEVNVGIIRHFWDGRVPFSKVARDLGVSENTIRSRVKLLEDRSILQIIGLIDPEFLPYHSVAFVGINAEPTEIVRVAEQVSNLKGVGMASCVSGRYNIMSFVMFNEEFSIEDFVRDELSKVEGITGIELIPIYKGFKMQCRYVL